jgi:hypothetical protein
LDTVSNHLIEKLPADIRRRLLDACCPVELPLSELISERDELTTHVYFPTTAFISLISMADSRAGVELGMIGREGMLGAHLCLNVYTSPLRGVVQGKGQAWRIPVDEFIDQMQASSTLLNLMQRYVYALNSQQATSAACLRFHQLDQRLARWLLMSQDRSQDEFLPLTNEFLAYMIGVRKVGSAIASSTLLREGMVEYRHGQIRVIDRDRLKTASCSCYASDNQTYQTLFGNYREQDCLAADVEVGDSAAPSDVPVRLSKSVAAERIAE